MTTPRALELASEEGRRPTWEIALLYPDQGSWTEDDYLHLDIGRHVDYSGGHVEFQAMPDEQHQAIVFFLVQALKAFASRHGGRATMAPFPMRLWDEKYREPDVLFMKEANLDRCQREITVLALHRDSYAVHGKFADGEEATSKILEGFAVDVTEVLAAE